MRNSSSLFPGKRPDALFPLHLTGHPTTWYIPQRGIHRVEVVFEADKDEQEDLTPAERGILRRLVAEIEPAFRSHTLDVTRQGGLRETPRGDLIPWLSPWAN
jgi:hypothetical protein